jgi:hypothetical protein
MYFEDSFLLACGISKQRREYHSQRLLLLRYKGFVQQQITSRDVICGNIGWNTVLFNLEFRGFPEYLKENPGIAPISNPGTVSP